MVVRILTDEHIAADDGRLPADAPLHARAVHALRGVLDPELPLNIYDLGLVYGLEVDEQAGLVVLTMTLTAPNCPVAEILPEQARVAVAEATGLATRVVLTFDPPWDKAKLSLEAKLALGLL